MNIWNFFRRIKLNRIVQKNLKNFVNLQKEYQRDLELINECIKTTELYYIKYLTNPDETKDEIYNKEVTESLELTKKYCDESDKVISIISTLFTLIDEQAINLKNKNYHLCETSDSKIQLELLKLRDALNQLNKVLNVL